MSRERLTDQRIRELWAVFDIDAVKWRGWHTDFLADLTWAQQVPMAELRTVEGQRKLWALTGLGTTGSSENLNIDPVLADETFVRTLTELRERGLQTAVSRRAQELQHTYDQLVRRYRELVPGNFARARLLRALHGLCPGQMLSTYKWEALLAVRDFLVGGRGGGEVENGVNARERLRRAIGTEQSLDEHAAYSMFTWWLYENQDTIARGEVPLVQKTPPPEVVDVEPLEIDAYARQHNSLGMYRGGLETVRLVLRECLEPQSPELVRDVLQEELEGLDVTDRYALQLLNDLRRLGFVRRHPSGYETTEAGEQLLDTNSREVLAISLIRRVSLFAFLLHGMAEQGTFRQSDAAALTARWFTDKSLAGHIRLRTWWGRIAGVFDKPDAVTFRVTDLGRALVQRLTGDLLAGATVRDDTEDEETGTTDVDTTTVSMPDYPTLRAHFESRCSERGLYFAPRQLLSLHAAWHFARPSAPEQPTKRFAILSGLSGTGKTQLLTQYASSICELMELDPEVHIAQVAVRPDWRDPTGLLGYLNALHAEPSFHAEPALELVLRARQAPHLPFFLLLDEMNLARVERYFAPFLSSMENGAPIQLHAGARPISGVPPQVAWPDNLRIGGSVNMDETTHPFSDKVLDRAFTLEFWSVDLQRYFAGRPRRREEDAPVEALLLALQAPLTRIRRHFGYRTAGEVLDWVAHASGTPESGVSQVELLDQAVFSKVLPRLRGVDSDAVRQALEELESICTGAGLSMCTGKLGAMRGRLHDTGVTGFWG